jgi:alanyl-tRNA synthetase
MKPEELECLEEKVNSKIKEKLRVEVLQKSYKEALKMGALALFDEKYGEKVRVLKVDDYSLELCGGTHVKSTGEILFFKVLSESALGAGVRRIEAVAGQVAKIAVIFRAKSMRDEVEELIRKYRLLEMEKGVLGGAKFTETGIFEIEATELESLSKAVDIQDSRNVNKFMDHLKGRVDWLKDRLVKTQKEIEDLKLRNVKNKAAEYIAEVMKSGETNILIKEFKDYTMEMLRIVSDRVQSELKSCVIVLASVVEENFIFLITVTPDLVAKGCSARQLSDIFTAVVGGRGGGKETKVEGGAKDINRISEGFAKILDTVGK